MTFCIIQRKFKLLSFTITQHSLKGEKCVFSPESLISNWSIKLARLHEGLLRLLSPTWPLLAALPHAQEGAAPMGSSATPCSGHPLSNDMILAVWSQLTLYLCQVIYCIMSILSFPILIFPVIKQFSLAWRYFQ